MKIVFDILSAVLYVLACAGLGVFVGRRLAKTKFDFFSSFFIGCGMVTVVLFILGSIGLFSKTFLIAFLVVIMPFAASGFRLFLRYDFSRNGLSWYLTILMAGLILIGGLASLSPPVKNDTLFYHLGLPRMWVADKSIAFYPSNPMSATALNSELLSVPLVGLISPESAQFAVFLIALGVAFLTVDIARRISDRCDKLVMAMIAGVPVFVSGIADAKSDYLAAGFSIAAFIMFLQYKKSRLVSNLLLSGMLAGLACGTKLNALIFALALTAIIIADRPRFSHLVAFVLAMLVFAAPWYVRAAIFSGNPFYPHFDSLFHSPLWSGDFDIFNAAIMPPTESKTILGFLTAPFRLVYLPDIFRGRIGPLPLILLPALMFYRNLPQPVVYGLWLSGVFYILWYFGLANARYLLPIIPILLVCGLYLIDKIGRTSRFGLHIVKLMIAVLLIINCAQMLRDNYQRILVAVGIVKKDRFLDEYTTLDPNEIDSTEKSKSLPYMNTWRFINNNLPENSKIGILCSNWSRADGFYLERKFEYLNPSEQLVVDFRMPEKIGRAIREVGIDYIVIDSRVMEEFSTGGRFAGAANFYKFAPGVEALRAFCRAEGKLLYESGDFALYGL